MGCLWVDLSLNFVLMISIAATTRRVLESQGWLETARGGSGCALSAARSLPGLPPSVPLGSDGGRLGALWCRGGGGRHCGGACYCRWSRGGTAGGGEEGRCCCSQCWGLSVSAVLLHAETWFVMTLTVHVERMQTVRFFMLRERGGEERPFSHSGSLQSL